MLRAAVALFVSAVCMLGLAVIALVAAAHPAQAQSIRNELYPKWQLTLSGAVVILGSTIRVDGSEGNGTEIDSEEDLGLSSTKLQPRAAVRWRPGRRHELEIGYQFSRRTAEKVLTRDIIFADSTYALGVGVNSKFDGDQAFLHYRYAFLAHDRTQVGLGVGLGALLFKIQLDALGDAGGPGVTFSRAKDFTAPTGSIGFYGRFLLGERWYLESDLRAIAVKVDRIDARILEANLAARYFLSDKLGLEAGYGISGIKLAVDPRTNGKGLVGLDVSGMIKYPLQNLRLGVVLTP